MLVYTLSHWCVGDVVLTYASTLFYVVFFMQWFTPLSSADDLMDDERLNPSAYKYEVECKCLRQFLSPLLSNKVLSSSSVSPSTLSSTAIAVGTLNAMDGLLDMEDDDQLSHTEVCFL